MACSSVVPTAVFAAAEDWGAGDGELTERIDRAAGELADLVTGAGTRRREPDDPFAATPSFETLLEKVAP